MKRLVLKVLLRFARLPLWIVSPRLCTTFSAMLLRNLGVRLTGEPNYLSAKIWFDGGDYRLIVLGHGITISSNVRILTHDWSPFTVARQYLGDSIQPRGTHGSVTLEDYCFIGTGAILLPGTHIGRGAIIGAGTVVKGSIEEGSVMVGNPARRVGSSLEVARRFYEIPA